MLEPPIFSPWRSMSNLRRGAQYARDSLHFRYSRLEAITAEYLGHCHRIAFEMPPALVGAGNHSLRPLGATALTTLRSL